MTAADQQARGRLIVELAAQRDELNFKAGQIEARAAMLNPSQDQEADKKALLDIEARELRDQAREIGRRWADLTEDQLMDDDRGSVT